MTTPAPARGMLPLVDGMRALAAGMVFVTHVTVIAGAQYYAFYGGLTPHVGEVGLACLFALSAFLLSRSWFAERAGGRPGPAQADYWRNRALRLIPAYWAALTVQLLVPGGFPGFTDPGVPQYGLVQIYSERWAFDGLKHTWTLCTEVAAYVLLVVHAQAARHVRGYRGELALVLAIGAVGPLTQFTIFTLRDHWLIALQWVFGYMDYIAVGLLLALVSVRHRLGSRPPALLDWMRAHPLGSWTLAAVVFLGQVIVLNPDDRLGYPPSDSAWRWTACHASVTLTGLLLLTPVILGQDEGGAPRRLLAVPALSWIGLRSYGFYLWHLPVLFWVKSVGWNTIGPVPMIPYAAISLVLTLVLSALSWRLVETPFHQLKSRRSLRAPAPATT